jgi:phosphatidylserine/phosphatidylglycerophosphate/cardiolipin synthase-like enzyme
VFGFAPGAVLRVIVLAFRRDDPRRTELLAELPNVPRIERPFWVCEQLEVALFEGLVGRLSTLINRKRYGRRGSAQELERALVPLASGGTARTLHGIEHDDLLAEALSTARHRLLVVSPFVTEAVVNADFAAKLEQLLQLGTEVTIVCGYSEYDNRSSECAFGHLKNLAKRYDRFTFRRIKQLHAKILIFDETYVTTSFNWLSWRSDSGHDRRYRFEEGTLISSPKHADEEYEQFRALVDGCQLS